MHSMLRGAARRATLGVAVAALSGTALLYAGSAAAAAVTVPFALATWEALVGPSTLQDFSGYPDGTSLEGVEVLPGVTATSNFGDLDAQGANRRMFGSGGTARADGNAYYEFNFSLPYKAFSFDIGAFENALPPFEVPGGAVDAGKVEVLFSDGMLFAYAIAANDGLSNIFFGVISDTTISRVRWYEALERVDVNEETFIDNIRVGAAEVPEPATYALMLAGLGLLGFAARRRRS